MGLDQDWLGLKLTTNLLWLFRRVLVNQVEIKA